MIHLFLFICVHLLVKNCNTQIYFTENICPPSTICVENTENLPGVFDGVCQCRDEYIFNPKHANDIDYCIKNTSNNSTYKVQSKHNDEFEQNIKSPSKTHHIVAGVLLPIAFVLIVLGGILVYKQLYVTQRIRDIRRTHRNRPFYEDVMLGTNDNDDPPLI